MTEAPDPDPLREAAAVCRGTRRLLTRLGFASATEVPLPNGQRADILALGERRASLWLVEIKSGPEDFRADTKWPAYQAYCDAFSFAVGPTFPRALLPASVGIIVADGHDGELIAEPPISQLAAARRRSLTQRLARQALNRLHALEDPWAYDRGPSS